MIFSPMPWHQGGAAPDAKRNVGPQQKADFTQLLLRKNAARQMVEPYQYAGGVGAAAGHARFHGNTLFHLNFQPDRVPPGGEKSLSRPVGEVLFSGGHGWIGTVQAGCPADPVW